MGMMMGTHTDNAPPLWLPMSFFLTGLAGLISALITLGTHAEDLVAFLYVSGPILAATHLMTLGFISMVMMGAMYQLVPVVLNTKLYSVPLGAWHYAGFLPGVVLLVSGFWGADTAVLIVGGSLVVASVILFLVNMGCTLARTSNWGMPGWYVATAIGYLALTVSMGWLLALNLWHPFLPVEDALPVHLALGGVGWFTMTLIGVSYKLLPMFSLTHAKPRFAWSVYGLINAAILTIGLGSWWFLRATLAGASVLATAGLALYLADLWQLWRKRLRRQPDPAVYLALTGAAGGIATVLAALLALTTFAWVLVFFLFFFGWLTTSILGYLQKIIPFLVWLHRYAHDIGRAPVPRMKDLWYDRWTWQVGTVYITGLAVAVVGLAMRNTAGLAGGLGLMLLGVLWLTTIVIDVLMRPRTCVEDQAA